MLCLMSKPSKLDKAKYPGAKSRYEDFVAVHMNQTMSIHGTVRTRLAGYFALSSLEGLDMRHSMAAIYCFLSAPGISPLGGQALLVHVQTTEVEKEEGRKIKHTTPAESAASPWYMSLTSQ